MAVVARELGISDVTLAAWVREQEKHSVAVDAAGTEAERQEAIALRKRIKELETEIEILKRSYWVNEGGQ